MVYEIWILLPFFFSPLNVSDVTYIDNEHQCTLEHLTSSTTQLICCCLLSSRAGHPIVGDGMYGDASSPDHVRSQGLFLEAVQLTLTHPVTGQPLDVQVGWLGVM